MPQHSPTRLDGLDAGASCRLVSIGGPRAFRRRLMELGLLPGASVRILRRVAVGGLVELEVRSARVSMRLSEAAEVMVEES